MKLIVFDTETTCLDFDKVEIWQLSGMKFDLASKSVERFNYNFRTKNPLSFEARKRCCMIQEIVDTYPEFDINIIEDSLELGNPDIYYIGHNIAYDRGVLKSVVKKYDINVTNLEIDNKWICTMLLSQRLLNHVMVNDISGSNPISFALDYLFHFLHLYDKDETLNFHDARFDVEVTWRLFKYLCNQYNLNPKTQIEEISRLSNSPFSYTYINFGKYKGMKWSDVYKKNSGYIKWCLNNMDEFNPDSKNYNPNLVYTLEHL